jgi:CTP synthase
VNLKFVEASIFDEENPNDYLQGVDGILVPGGFGERGAEGKIKAAQFARENKIPYFGICFGLQMAVLDCARNLCGIMDATSTEFGEGKGTPLIGLMTEWMKGNELEARAKEGDMGGTMRLGAYPCHFDKDSKIAQIYATTDIEERHRHRYEVNMNYRAQMESAGFKMAGVSPDGRLPETCEYVDHPWFIGVQYHPELKSKPFDPHPLFVSFIEAAVKQSRLV